MERHPRSVSVVASVILWIFVGLGWPPGEQLAAASGQAGRALTLAQLEKARDLGQRYLLQNQTADGLFHYRVHVQTGEIEASQNWVRQAGAGWGLALIHADRPSEQTRQALLRTIGYFENHSRLLASQSRMIDLGELTLGDTGVLALHILTLVDFINGEIRAGREVVREQQLLRQYLAALLRLRRADQQFYSKYDLRSGEGWGPPSPYFDGEALLAWIKASRLLEDESSREAILETAEVCYRRHCREARQQLADSPITKGYFQWGLMAWFELIDAGWAPTQVYSQRMQELALWMIREHRTLERSGNTGYAYEGIILAWEIGRRQGGEDRVQRELLETIQKGLGKLLTWQVGAEATVPLIAPTTQRPSSVVGGVLSSEADPWLRIDTTQHQTHAVLLALRYLKPND